MCVLRAVDRRGLIPPRVSRHSGGNADDVERHCISGNYVTPTAWKKVGGVDDVLAQGERDCREGGLHLDDDSDDDTVI